MTTVARNLANQSDAKLSTRPGIHVVVRDDECEEFQSFLDNSSTSAGSRSPPSGKPAR